MARAICPQDGPPHTLTKLYRERGYCTSCYRSAVLALDAALGVTYTPFCPECRGATKWQCSGCRKRFDGDLMLRCPNCGREGYWTGSVAPCPSCNGSGRSAPRLALIDVLVAGGALEQVGSLVEGTHGAGVLYSNSGMEMVRTDGPVHPLYRAGNPQ